MSAHADEKIAELVLGGLDAAERTEVEAHLAACPRCAAERIAVEEALALYVWAQDAAPTPAAVRSRLLETVRSESSVLEKLVRMFDVAREQAIWLLGRLSDPTGWVPGPLEGMQLFHFTAGPRAAGADTGLIRFPGGLMFPSHKHLGDELMLVVEGGFQEIGGRHVGVGEHLAMAAGTEHSFLMDPEGCVSAVALHVGIEVAGLGKLYVHDFKGE